MTLWPYDALHSLFELRDILELPRRRTTSSSYRRYIPKEPYQLPLLADGVNPLLLRIHNLFQSIIDDASARRQNIERPVDDDHDIHSIEPLFGAHGMHAVSSTDRACYLLTDLLPGWVPIFNRATNISQAALQAANAHFDREIKPLLSDAAQRYHGVHERALDILDLPFWKHRWQTYEAWATVLTLQALADYQPMPLAPDGIITLQSYRPVVVSNLRNGHGCVALQASTRPLLRRIRPDLRICESDCIDDATNTVAVVEFKQRQKLHGRELIAMCDKYIKGSRASAKHDILEPQAFEQAVALMSESARIDRSALEVIGSVNLRQTRFGDATAIKMRASR